MNFSTSKIFKNESHHSFQYSCFFFMLDPKELDEDETLARFLTSPSEYETIFHFFFNDDENVENLIKSFILDSAGI